MGVVVIGGGWCRGESDRLCLGFGGVLGTLGCRGSSSGTAGGKVCGVNVVGWGVELRVGIGG
jgi:hypothetical protein